MDDTIKASDFKARCLALLDEVAESGQPVVVTKHGRAVARLVPMPTRTTTAGSVTITDEGDNLFSTGERWDAEA
ncbi:MAG: type II toxin-antitoxin system Phd/YefM family antitoxin [Microthrixaceae bacterium]